MPHEHRPGEVFVFGSNLAGIHGAGAARDAFDLYGAKWGKCVGKQGASYAIPTKNGVLQTMPLEAIKLYVDEFLDYAKAHPDEQFFLTRIGCGLAGYKDAHIAPMFAGATENVRKPEGW